MDKQDLRKLSVKCIKYATFRVDASTALKGAENFEDLLRFIGVHKNYGRSYYAGNAYEAIRIRTDEILRLSNPKKSELRTRKREIQSIRQCFKCLLASSNEYKLKIPFKAEYIFQAIISLVDEICKEQALPLELRCFHGLTYGEVFYKKHIDEYMAHLDEVKEDYLNYSSNTLVKCRYQLYNDFTASSSSFMVVFNPDKETRRI